MKKIKILIAAHKEFSSPTSNIYLPIQVGRSLAKKQFNLQGDNEGENISERNDQFCELTATYWAWKNMYNYEYIGLCHYRRFFTFAQVPLLIQFEKLIRFILIRYIKNPLKPGSLSLLWSVKKVKKLTQSDVFSDIFQKKLDICLNDNDIIALKKIKLSNINIKLFWSSTVSSHVFDKIEISIKNKYPDIFPTYIETIYGNKIHPCNMAIFKKNIFIEYSNFIFTILFEIEQLLKESEIVPFPRTMGYIGEVLTSTFITFKKKNGTKVKTLNMLIINESK